MFDVFDEMDAAEMAEIQKRKEAYCRLQELSPAIRHDISTLLLEMFMKSEEEQMELIEAFLT